MTFLSLELLVSCLSLKTQCYYYVLCHFGLFLFGDLSFIFLLCDTDWFIYGNKTWVQNLDVYFSYLTRFLHKGTWKLSGNIN